MPAPLLNVNFEAGGRRLSLTGHLRLLHQLRPHKLFVLLRAMVAEAAVPAQLLALTDYA